MTGSLRTRFLRGLLTLGASCLGIFVIAPHLAGAQIIEPSADLLFLTNQARLAAGQSLLQANTQLTAAAQAKARDMLEGNYFDHTSPTGTAPWDFIQKAGYRYVYAGENLAIDYPNSLAMFDAWMASPTHRDNILFPKYQETGIAVVSRVVNGETVLVAVQMFGSRTDFVAARPTLQDANQTPQHTTAFVDGAQFRNEKAAEYVTAGFSRDGSVWQPAHSHTQLTFFVVFVIAYLILTSGLLLYLLQREAWKIWLHRLAPALPLAGLILTLTILRR